MPLKLFGFRGHKCCPDLREVPRDLQDASVLAVGDASSIDDSTASTPMGRNLALCLVAVAVPEDRTGVECNQRLTSARGNTIAQLDEIVVVSDLATFHREVEAVEGRVDAVRGAKRRAGRRGQWIACRQCKNIELAKRVT